MSTAEETESKPEKKAKKRAVPEVPPAEKETPPTASEVRAAKKAELVAWSQRYGLDAEGKVDELRRRLLDHLEKGARKEAAPEAEPPRAVEKPLAEKPPKKVRAEAKAKEPAEEVKKAKKPTAKGGAEEEEEKVHEARAKPKVTAEVRKLLALRGETNRRRPAFHRQEWFRYRKFGDEWRKPQGGQSKLRRHFGYRWNVPSIGYRGPRGVRGLHPSGFQEVLVHNAGQLEGLDAATQAVRIARGVGARKRGLIEKACQDKGLRVLNRMVTE